VEFDFASLKRILGIIALVGLLGNHLLYDVDGISMLHNYNNFVGSLAPSDRQAFGEVDVSYVNLLFNPFLPFENIGSWNIFYHLLAWPGLAAAFGWVIVTFAGKKKAVPER
jgi:hypothetical protein